MTTREEIQEKLGVVPSLYVVLANALAIALAEQEGKHTCSARNTLSAFALGTDTILSDASVLRREIGNVLKHRLACNIAVLATVKMQPRQLFSDDFVHEAKLVVFTPEQFEAYHAKLMRAAFNGLKEAGYL
jgi:hypothetical protein